MVPTVQLALKGRLVPRALMARTVQMEQRVHRDRKVLQALPAPMVLTALMVQLDHKGRLGQLERPVRKVLLALPVPMVQMELTERQDPKDPKGHKALRARMVPTGQLVLKVRQVPRALTARTVQMVLMEQLALKDHKVRLVQMVPTVQLVLKVRLGQLVRPVRKAHKGRQGLRGQPGRRLGQRIRIQRLSRWMSGSGLVLLPQARLSTSAETWCSLVSSTITLMPPLRSTQTRHAPYRSSQIALVPRSSLVTQATLL